LPAQWNDAKILRLPIGSSRVGLEFHRAGTLLSVRITADNPKELSLGSRAPGAKIQSGEVLIPLPSVEVGVRYTLPQLGSNTSEMKVLDERWSAHSLRLQLSAPANSVQSLMLRKNDPKVHLRVEGGEISSDSPELLVRFPPGTGYREKGVILSW